ncbi:Hypothetical_protein [Hexamita inflata]|uniref:Hypothetical_protein n=1 Tax=Hexamita inflata TaxID=28002 RepID=A0AA86PQ33_9EUKA|nr:Hypothetical protein HINF_LOCUS31925 [Hexamita inflata]CAI9963606.1 Hypothetical protein HINF_LOCUS51251 [Hexamita inflata]
MLSRARYNGDSQGLVHELEEGTSFDLWSLKQFSTHLVPTEFMNQLVHDDTHIVLSEEINAGLVSDQQLAIHFVLFRFQNPKEQVVSHDFEQKSTIELSHTEVHPVLSILTTQILSHS